MKCLQRNKTLLYYALYTGKTYVEDTNGNRTGEYTVSYTSPAPLMANISAARGTADLEEFGINLNYTKTIVMDNPDCPIDEHSVLWLGFKSEVPYYDSASYYWEGDIVQKSGVFYRAKGYVTPGNWDSTKWETVPYNFVVVSVARSINSVKYAIKEVDVS